MKRTFLIRCCLAVCWLLFRSSCGAASRNQTNIDAASPAIAEARAEAAEGHTQAAIQKYREAIQRSPGNASLDLEFSRYLGSTGRYPEAIGMYQECLRLAPGKEEAELGLAEAYRRVHNPDAARSVLHSARRRHPKSVAVLGAIGSLEIEAESPDAAIAALEAAVAIAPENPSLPLLLATAHLGKGEKEAALRELQSVLAHEPANLAALFLRAQIHADRNENEQALADVQKVFAAQPANVKARKLLAKVLVRLQKCQQAANLFTSADSLPLDAEELFLLGNAYDCAGQEDAAKRAREEFSAASENDRRRAENEVQSKHLYEQANELARQNKLSAALEVLAEALEKNPANGFAYSQQAKIFFSMHENEKARGAISQALAIQPYQPDFLYVAGVIAESEGREKDALAAFTQVTEINPKEADAYYEMGRIFLNRQDRARALAAFRKAASLEPNDPDYKRALEAVSSGPFPKP